MLYNIEQTPEQNVDGFDVDEGRKDPTPRPAADLQPLSRDDINQQPGIDNAPAA